MDRDSLLDLARSLVTELENDTPEINPNDVSNILDDLRDLEREIDAQADEVRNIRYSTVQDADDAVDRAADDVGALQDRVRDIADNLESLFSFAL